jgi:hypothetical protein
VPKHRSASEPQHRRPWLNSLALAIVLGRGPVPWIHTHETLARHGHSENALTWHLEHFHQPDDGDDHRWHIHWTFPWQILNCPCQQDTSSSQERASALQMPFVAAESVAVNDPVADAHAGAPPPMLTLGEIDNPPPRDELCGTSLHFLESYFPTVTPRALFCVARC